MGGQPAYRGACFKAIQQDRSSQVRSDARKTGQSVNEGLAKEDGPNTQTRNGSILTYDPGWRRVCHRSYEQCRGACEPIHAGSRSRE